MIQIAQAKGIAVYSFRHEQNKLCTILEMALACF
mgnify:CR=1 FL=1